MPKSIDITFDGKTQCISAWAREFGITIPTIYHRLKQGLSSEEVLSPDRSNGLNITFGGKTQGGAAWAKEFGIPISTIRSRLKKGLSSEKVLRRPNSRMTF